MKQALEDIKYLELHKISEFEMFNHTQPWKLWYDVILDEVKWLERKLITIDEYSFNILPADICK